MSWNSLFYPPWADKNGDGKVDLWEQTEADYEYDAVMGTNISGAFPEHDETPSADDNDDDYIDRLIFGDDEDLFDDDFLDSSDFDEDELAEKYSERLDLLDITEADWDGYFTDDGEFHVWKIDDMFDYSDDDGFWDKCGNYHE